MEVTNVRYQHINLEEREKLYALREQGISLRNIAKELGRSQSSLTRELKRNRKYGNEYLGNGYLPCKAQQLAENRSARQRRKAPLKNPNVFLYVREHLRLEWSPELIAGRLKRDRRGESICHETIYQYIYGDNKQVRGLHLEQYLTLKRKKRMKKEGRRVRRQSKISEAISIDLRPKYIEKRKEVGHWETDNIIGKQTDQSVLSVTVERKSRVTILTKLEDKTAATKSEAIIDRLGSFPNHWRKTVTTDNGAENNRHKDITKNTGMIVYFCHPYHSWEKGTVENMNGRIRRFIPKGHSIDAVTPEFLATLEDKLNSTPRKCLNFLTPYEMIAKLRK